MQCMQREAPDLRYVDGTRVLNLELTDAYYDEQSDAAMQWDAARKKANAPDSWSGGDFDRALIKNINAGIAKKCRKDYAETAFWSITSDLPVIRPESDPTWLQRLRVQSAVFHHAAKLSNSLRRISG
jgi:hypothetical protein